jgi:Phosphotransferase enzyme family
MDVTAGWLTSALTESGALTRGSVTGVEWRTIGEEYGFASVTGRVGLRLQDANADAPTSLVAKLPTEERWEQGEREVRFYRELDGAPMPNTYYADADHVQRRAILLLEDLTGGRQGDVLEGCSVDDARSVLEAMAPFHAQHWDGRSAPFWLRHEELDPQARQARYVARVERFARLYGSVVPDDVLRLVEQLRARLGDVIVQLEGGPQTLIHADLHLDNLLFDPRPERPVVVLDWQTTRVGNPASDVAFFIFGSLDVEDRRSVESALFDEYVALLVEHGVTGYDHDRLLSDSRLALLAWLNGVVGWLVGPEPDRERMRAVREAAFFDGRLVAALRDHDVASLLEP